MKGMEPWAFAGLGFGLWTIFIIFVRQPYMNRYENAAVTFLGLFAIVFISMAVCELMNRRSKRKPEDKVDS
jgi:hypothetical protein